MNAAVLAILSLVAFTLAFKIYARWIERRVYDMDSDEKTPAHATPDGIDFVPCTKHVLFGHHFCSVAGAAPIVGPALAVFWGWLPALLWVVFGSIFLGAVPDQVRSEDPVASVFDEHLRPGRRSYLRMDQR